MAGHPNPKDQLRRVLEENEKKVRVSVIVAVIFLAISFIIGLVSTFSNQSFFSSMPFYFLFYLFLGVWALVIDPILIVLAVFFVYYRLRTDSESASSSALVIGIIAILTGNITAGVILLVARQFLLTRLDIHYNFK